MLLCLKVAQHVPVLVERRLDGAVVRERTCRTRRFLPDFTEHLRQSVETREAFLREIGFTPPFDSGAVEPDADKGEALLEIEAFRTRFGLFE